MPASRGPTARRWHLVVVMAQIWGWCSQPFRQDGIFGAFMSQFLKPRLSPQRAVASSHSSPDAGVVLATLSVVTLNLRYDEAQDRAIGQGWLQRQGLVARLLASSADHGQGLQPCDVVGTQEGLAHQLRGLDAALAEVGTGEESAYSRVGRGRNWLGGGEHCAIYYRRNALKLLEEGTFSLSEKPECMGRRDWGAACPRIGTYARLGLPGGQGTLLVINTHLDHVSEEARYRGAELLAAKATELEMKDPLGSPPLLGTLVLGDFNCAQRCGPEGLPGRVFEVFQKAGFWSASDVAEGMVPSRSFHAWGGKAVCDMCSSREHAHIDWVLWRGKGLRPTRFEVVTAEGDSGVLPSDHFPVYAQFQLRPPR
ncbi:unnamed protein product [Polarella glacialis]|uniref:Endonuclease/exonuclease/phosphatase domain-containing protein n=1 Tax=Polarella glacialis TaxID=89957 RepID=A0A813FC72_POLGL|nr:unnamed protein product [Polarella glacialis]